MKENLEMWLRATLDPETRAEIDQLKKDPLKLRDAFYTRLSFGTGGLRGLVGVGSNRINAYTIRLSTQGLANYLSQYNPKNSVFISYDSRLNSRFLAEEAAKVLAGNGITAYITQEMRPTPLASFGCRALHCSAAIMITASHNPPEYNGYKVYGNDGSQVVPPEDQRIVDEVNKIIDLRMVKTAEKLDHPLIKWIGKEMDEEYLSVIKSQRLLKKQKGSLKIVYTSLHGTGITLIPQALASWGFKELDYVEEQVIPDGRFPTVKYPNPEEKEALSLGLKKLEESKADLLIATDPDADRVGIAVMHQGKPNLLNGNQVACILLDHVCKAFQGNLPLGTAVVKTIATSELFQAIAESYQAPCFDVPTGFKFIAETIRNWEKSPHGYRFLFGGEESYGYLLGTHVRDKDAIISSLLIAEAALAAKLTGKTLVDHLHDLWKKYGVFVEKLDSIQFPETQEGREQMKQGMERLLNSPPQSIAGTGIASIHQKDDLLLLWLKDGSKLLVRPSGTEPKIKIYCGVNKKGEDLEQVEKALSNHALELIKYTKELLQPQNQKTDETIER